jgi:heterotetrameric sarcosine oxidase delta subunit
MLRIACPWCGPRDEIEFVNGGETPAARPPQDASDANWTAHLFEHANPRGPLRERWLHAYGCRRWFDALRDTASHEILAVTGIDDPDA